MYSSRATGEKYTSGSVGPVSSLPGKYSKSKSYNRITLLVMSNYTNMYISIVVESVL